MIQSKKDWREPSAPDDTVEEAKQERNWKAIAEEASKEQDGAKLLELTNRLIVALDNRTA